MFKLSIDFHTTQELCDFVSKLGGVPASLKVEEAKAVEPKVEEAKKKEKPKKTEPTLGDIPVPPVIEEAPKKPAFNREAAIKLATETVRELTERGVSGAELAQHLADLYASAECPIGVKISQLDDEQLARFIPLFTEKASALKKPAQSASFI